MSAEEIDELAAARAEVERTREELGNTVEAIAYKADVKARARDKVDEVKAQAAEKVEEVRTQATHTVEEARQTASHKVEEVRTNPPPPTQLIAAAAIGLAIIAVVLWRRRSR